LPVSTFIATRLEQPLNASSPIEITELGMVMLVKLVQPENVNLPIEVTEFEIVTLVKP